MINKKNDKGYTRPVVGVERKTLVFGAETLMTEFRLTSGSEIPMHRHPHEQTGYLVSGRLRMHVESKTYDCEAGDSWCIPANISHGAEALENTVAVEVFSPVREDYLPETGGQNQEP